MELKRIGPWSVARVSGAIYAAIGLIVGGLFALAALVGSGVAAANGEDGAIVGALFGVGAIVFLPLFYGVMGIVGGALVAWLYNVFSGMVGGIELQFDAPGGTAVRPS